MLIPGRAATPFERTLQAILLAVAVGVLILGVVIMLAMDAGSRGQGGRFYVALGALVVLGMVDGQILKVARRRWPVQIGTSGEERRYALVSLLLLVVCGGLLLGFALLFP